jgi:large repetitive protein
MLRSKTIPARLGRVGVAAVVAAAGSVTLFQGVSNAAPLTYTASPATGPAANATYVVTLTGTGFANAAGASLVKPTTGVQFSTTCSANSTTTPGTSAAAFNVISATRLAVTTPSLTLVGTSTAFKVCVFDSTTPFNLLGSATYTIFAAPAITAAMVPASGPAFGGNTVAITGTGFTSTSKVTIGGVAATSVKITGTTGITATAPAHAASATAAQVIVTTQGGPNPTPGTATFDDYTYQSAIQVSPGFGAAGTVIDVKGVGFSSLVWTGATAAAVYLVDGPYDPTAVSAAKTHAQTGTCGSVQVLADTELVCVVPTLAGALGNAAYTITVVNDSSVDAQTNVATYSQSVVSSGATFTISPF